MIQLANSLCEPAEAKSFLLVWGYHPRLFSCFYLPVFYHVVCQFAVVLFKHNASAVVCIVHVAPFPNLHLTDDFISLLPQSSVHQRGRGLATRGSRPLRPTSGTHLIIIAVCLLWKIIESICMQNTDHPQKMKHDAWARVGSAPLLCLAPICN